MNYHLYIHFKIIIMFLFAISAILLFILKPFDAKAFLYKIYYTINELNYNDIFNVTPDIVVLDDCLPSKGNWMKDPNIINLIENAKHYNKIFILTISTWHDTRTKMLF